MHQTSSQPAALLTLINDDTTPSGVRLAPQDGSREWHIRYQQPGADRRQHFATSLLDLVAQNTQGAASLNGKTLVQANYTSLLELILIDHAYGKKNKLAALVNHHLNIIVAEI